MYSMFDESGVYDNGSYLCLDVSNIDTAINYVKTNKIKDICINNFTEDKKKVDLTFLKDLAFLKKIYINSSLLEITGIEVLYDLEKLEDLVWFCEEALNIKKFNNLKSLAVLYPENMNFQSSTITKLEVSHLESIKYILGIVNLEVLTLRSYEGESIYHIDEFEYLNSLTMRVAKKLVNIESLNRCLKLQFLEFEKIRKDLELEPLSKCSNLAELYIYNKIKNCDFINNMKSINLLLCEEILSGELSPLFNNNKLRNVKLLGYKKYYNHSKKEFENRFDSW